MTSLHLYHIITGGRWNTCDDVPKVIIFCSVRSQSAPISPVTDSRVYATFKDNFARPVELVTRAYHNSVFLLLRGYHHAVGRFV